LDTVVDFFELPMHDLKFGKSIDNFLKQESASGNFLIGIVFATTGVVIITLAI